MSYLSVSSSNTEVKRILEQMKNSPCLCKDACYMNKETNSKWQRMVVME